jgi:hypothetical protein
LWPVHEQRALGDAARGTVRSARACESTYDAAVSDGLVRGLGNVAGRAVRVAMIGSVVLVAACGSSSPDAGPGGGAVTASTAGTSTSTSTSTSTTVADPDADITHDTRALATADDLGPEWSTKQKGTTTTKLAAERKKGFAVDCPDLAASHPALREDAESTTVSGPSFDRTKPSGQLTQALITYASEDDAKDVIAALEEPGAEECATLFLGRQKGAPKATVNKLEATRWELPSSGDGTVGFDVDADLSDQNGERAFHLGLAFIRVGRTIDFVGIFSQEPMGESDVEAVVATVEKLVKTAQE